VTLDFAWEQTSNDMGQFVDGPARQLFQARHPNVSLNFIHMGNAREKVLAQSAAGTPPHVLHLAVALPAFYVTRGLLLPIESAIQKDKDNRKEEFAPPLWDAFSIKGRQYALPREGGPTVLYYNKTLVQTGGVAAPTDSWTLAGEYRDAAIKLTRPTGAQDVIGTDLNNWRNWVWSNGGELLDVTETRYALDGPAAVEALQLFSDFRYKFRCATTPAENQQLSPINRFIAGGLALLPGLRSAANTRNFTQPHVGIALHPRGKAGRKFNMPGNGLALMRQPAGSPGSKLADLAYEAVRWYVSAEFQKLHYQAGIGGVVARLSVLKSEEYLSSAIPREWNEFFARSVADLKVPPKLNNWPEIDDTLTNELAPFLNGQETATAATARIAPIVNAMLRESQR
jgi:multiple sugar transport system substrate-binding protein